MDIQQNILEWLHKLRGWQTELTYRILTKNIEEEDVIDIIELLKSDSIFTTKEFPQILNFETKKQIKLISIESIQNIESLAPRNPLKFEKDKNLIVLYGANGAGKSGYTKIIKKLSGKPRALNLKPNVFKPNSDGRCKISYSVDNIEQQVDWIINADPINDLKSIDVFDTSTGNIYIDEANAVTYTPGVIRIFSALSHYFSVIQEKLDQEKRSLIKVLPSIPLEYRNTEASKLFNNINKDNTSENLSSILIWNEAKEQSKKELKNRLTESDPKKVAEDLKKRKIEVDKIVREISDALILINEDSLKEINTFKKDAINKRKISNESSLVIANKSELQGIGSQVWKALWESARFYSNHEAYTNKSFPNIDNDSKCVLCHQTLNEEAKQRFTSFETFIKSKIESEAVIAERIYSEKINKLPNSQTKEALLTKCNAANLNDEWLNCLINIWDQIDKSTNSVKQNLEFTIDYKYILDNLNILKSISDSYDMSSKQYELDAQQFDRTKASKDLLELCAQKWCSEQKDQILQEVERLIIIFTYDSWISQCNTRSITIKASEISELVITEEYVKRFNIELGLLKANRIKVELVKERASRGNITHSLRLKGINGNKLSEILSEGEHRIIALASFLADVTGGNNNNPFVFDDPISSLDQKFEEKVVERLVELSKTRQVIVFTHRLSLLGQLNEKCSSNLIQVLGIRSENWGSGEIGETPLFAKKTLPALNHLKNDRLSKAKKIFNEEGSEAYYPYGKSLCSDIRILVERIVELDFLADVVQRYRRAVNTMGKVQNLAKIGIEDCNLINDFMTRYSCFEHSQPEEAPIEILEPNEIEIDIENLINWLNEFNARK